MKLLKKMVDILKTKKFKKWSLNRKAYKKSIQIYIKKILSIISGKENMYLTLMYKI